MFSSPKLLALTAPSRHRSPKRGRRGKFTRGLRSSHQRPRAGKPSGFTPTKETGEAGEDTEAGTADPLRMQLSFEEEKAAPNKGIRNRTGIARTHVKRNQDEDTEPDILVWGLTRMTIQETRAFINKACRKVGTTVAAVKKIGQRNGVRRHSVHLSGSSSVQDRSKAYRSLRRELALIGGRALRPIAKHSESP